MVALSIISFVLLTTTNGNSAQASGYPLPAFELPYYANTGPYWSGGPHQWGKGPDVVFMDLYSGSGIDFAKNGETFPVAAMAEGDVIWASETDQSGGLGIKVAVKHSVGGSIVIYGHLSDIWQPILDAMTNGSGYHVYPGYTIGYAGSTGTDNVHLHVELRDGSRDCCGARGDGGSPISWHGIEVNGYRIYNIRPNELGINPNPPHNEVAYNYDGVAVQVSDLPSELGPFGYDHFSFPDYSGAIREFVYTWLPSDFVCDGVSNCETNTHPDVEFAAHGHLGGGGGILVSDMTIPAGQPQPGSPTPTPVPTETVWLLEFSKAESPPFEVNIHTRVNAPAGIYDAHRILVDGNQLFETGASEYYHTWNTYGVADGHHTLAVEYRRLSDGGSWTSALRYEEQYYLSPNRSAYAPCSANVDGAQLTSGSDCIKVTQDVGDLAPVGWADRYNLQVCAVGNTSVWVYDGSGQQGIPKIVDSGQCKSVGNNVSSIALMDPTNQVGPLPDAPFATTSETIVHYRFNGNGNNETGAFGGGLQGSTTYITGKFGQGINVPNPPDGSGVNIEPAITTASFTIDLWLARTVSIGAGRVICQLGYGSGVEKWCLQLIGNNIELEIWSAGGSQKLQAPYDLPTNGSWHYINASYDGGNTAILYVDNKYAGTLVTAGVMYQGAALLEIGRGAGIYSCNCMIDEVRLRSGVHAPDVGSDPEPEPTTTPEPSPTATPTTTPLPPQGVELLPQPLILSASNGSAEESVGEFDPDVLMDKDFVRITYNLHGLCALGGDASAFIFNQGEWMYISLSDYGQNCLNGVQTVDVPLSDFWNHSDTVQLDLTEPIEGIRARFWYGSAFNVEILSAIAMADGGTSPTATPTLQPTATPTSAPLPTATPTSEGIELLSEPWHLQGAYGDSQEYQGLDWYPLQGKSMVRVTLDLNGLWALGGDASALIFDQNGWQFVSLSEYVQNGYDGVQVIDIPLEDFMDLDPEEDTDTLHTRFWCNCQFEVDITSVVALP